MAVPGSISVENTYCSEQVHTVLVYLFSRMNKVFKMKKKLKSQETYIPIMITELKEYILNKQAYQMMLFMIPGRLI